MNSNFVSFLLLRLSPPSVPMFLLKKAKVLFAFLVMASTWMFQERFLEMLRPSISLNQHVGVCVHVWCSHGVVVYDS